MRTRLETPRLVIRTFRESDADAWLSMVTDPMVRRFLPGPVPTAATFATALASRHAMEDGLGYAMWAVEDRATGQFVGQCGLRPASSMDPAAGDEIDMGYHYVPQLWGKGYATEAAVAVLAFGFASDGPGLNRVMAVTMPENVGSWRVMEKSGMRYEGLADYYGLSGLKKYAAERAWWVAPE